MHVCLDVGYDDTSALSACVGFHDWADRSAAVSFCESIENVMPYESGKFFQRELPCLLMAIEKVAQPIETIIIDGNVRLDDKGRPGLGQYLFEAVDGRAAVIGVAKTKFDGLDSAQVLFRGDSIRPLYVTAVGIEECAAAKLIGSMHGPHRIPTLLKLVDRLSRGD